MPFDPSTAVAEEPVTGFNPATATPVESPEEFIMRTTPEVVERPASAGAEAVKKDLTRIALHPFSEPIIPLPKWNNPPDVPALGLANPANIAGSYIAAAPFVEGAETPFGLATLGVFGVVGSLAKAGVPWAINALKLGNAAFGGLMAGETVKGVQNAIAVSKNPSSTRQENVAAWASPALSGTAAALSAVPAIAELINPRPTPLANTAAQLASASKKGDNIGLQNTLNQIGGVQPVPLPVSEFDIMGNAFGESTPLKPTSVIPEELNAVRLANEQDLINKGAGQVFIPGETIPGKGGATKPGGPPANAREAAPELTGYGRGPETYGKFDPTTAMAEPSKQALIDSAVGTKGVDYQYSVFRPGEGLPDAIQVDVLSPDRSTSLVSSNVADLQKAGADIPAVPDWVPQGRYTLSQLNDIIKKGPENAIRIEEATTLPVLSEIPRETSGGEFKGVGEQNRLQEPAPTGNAQEAVSGLVEPKTEVEQLKANATGPAVVGRTPAQLEQQRQASAIRQGVSGGWRGNNASGFITPDIAARMAGTAAGATYGYATGDNTEDSVRRALWGGFIGFGLTSGASFLIKNRARLGQLMTERPVKAEVTTTREAADNSAGVFAVQQANLIRHDVDRAFPSTNKASDVLLRGYPEKRPLAENALTFVVEAMDNPDNLKLFRNTINNSTKANPQWKKTALEAIDFAEKNWNELSPIASKYASILDAEHGMENGVGVESPYRIGYVYHVQDLEGGDKGFLSNVLSPLHGSGESARFKLMREHNTYADSIAAGVDPKSLNAVDLLQARVRMGQRMINSKAWVESLKTINDPVTGKPLVQPLETVKRPDGTTYQVPPEGYARIDLHGQGLSVLQDYKAVWEALNGRGLFPDSGAFRLFQEANQTGKHVSLVFDSFHLGRISAWAAAHRSAGIPIVGTGKFPWPSYRKGLSLLDNSIPELQNMIQRGEIPKNWATDILEGKRRLDIIIRNGGNLGGITDNLYQDFIQSAPILKQTAGRFNKWLFGTYQRGVMADMGILQFERTKAAHPSWTDDQVGKEAAQFINTRMGNIGRQGWFRSRQAQDVMRSMWLAAQWNEGLIMSEVRALTDIPKAIKSGVQKGEWTPGPYARTTFAMLMGYFLGNQAINMITRGHPTWENPEEGYAAKISAWIPGKDYLGNGQPSGFFLNPFSLGGEITHLLAGRLERGKTMTEAIMESLQSRASTAARPLWTLATGKQAGGIPLKRSELAKEAIKSAVPTPIPSSSLFSAMMELITGAPSEQFPGQYQRQLMSSTGFKPDTAPTALNRIYQLANDFNEAHDIKSFGRNEPSQWGDLNRVLIIGNTASADRLLGEMLVNRTPEQVFRHYEQSINRAFTGSMDREQEFFNTLNPEQKQAYFHAAEAREIVFKRSMQALLNAKQNGTLARAYLKRINGMDEDSANEFLSKEADTGFLDGEVYAQMRALMSGEKIKPEEAPKPEPAPTPPPPVPTPAPGPKKESRRKTKKNVTFKHNDEGDIVGATVEEEEG